MARKSHICTHMKPRQDTTKAPAAILFRSQLQQEMTRRGISQYALAEASGIDRTYLIKLLQGKNAPTLAVAERLAEAVGVPLWRMLK